MRVIRRWASHATRLLRSGDRPWVAWLFTAVTIGVSVLAGLHLAQLLDDDVPAGTPPACLAALDAAETMFAIDDRLITLSTELGYAAHYGDTDAAAEVTAEWEALWPDIEAAVTAYWAAAVDCRWPHLTEELAR